MKSDKPRPKRRRPVSAVPRSTQYWLSKQLDALLSYNLVKSVKTDPVARSRLAQKHSNSEKETFKPSIVNLIPLKSGGGCNKKQPTYVKPKVCKYMLLILS